MTSTPSLAAYRSSNFAPAFLFLPAPRRRALKSIYAFCRAVDDAVDRPGPNGDRANARETLDGWRRILRDPHDDIARDRIDPVVWRALHETLSDFAVEPRHLLDLVDGVARDLDQKRYRTFDDLKAYCHGVASTVGLACLPVFGLNEEDHREFAVNLGIAVQLTNILRDLASDAARDRVYLPQEDLKRFGYSEAELLRSLFNENFVRLMRFQVSRAREYYARAMCALPASSRRRARPAVVMAKLYHALLAEIERRNYDVFTRRMRLSPWQKLRCVLEALF